MAAFPAAGRDFEAPYEYTVREDICWRWSTMTCRTHGQSAAGLPQPTGRCVCGLGGEDTGYMDDIWQTVEERAKTEADKQRQAKSKQAPER